MTYTTTCIMEDVMLLPPSEVFFHESLRLNLFSSKDKSISMSCWLLCVGMNKIHQGVKEELRTQDFPPICYIVKIMTKSHNSAKLPTSRNLIFNNFSMSYWLLCVGMNKIHQGVKEELRTQDFPHICYIVKRMTKSWGHKNLL